ncbi:transcription antitermination factor NusB [Demequina sp.]|uniref:transcription antitermination factor NusB n=1 Tax=Demequina sp. TaxID=2050685 RepID=UPI0025F55024|nr:transcription antitermination factor NusB [Demequina sp.]
MAARTKARKRALDVLFEADQRGANVLAVLDERLVLSGRETPLPEYSAQIVRGVVAWWREIDAIIQDASPEWQIRRMPAVDRALLRIAAWEILCNDEVSTGTAIDEAVTLASDLSTDDSPAFINGVLGTIAREAPALKSADS